MADRLAIVVTGGLGAMPFAGVAWQVLHYIEGFRRLGHDVFYLEDTGSWPYDPEQETVSEDPQPAVRYIARMLERCGLERGWAYREGVNGTLLGVSEDELTRVLERADALVNVSGVTVLGERLLEIPVRIYLETDPVRPQFEIAQGNQFAIEFLASHTHHFTYGENFGAPDCDVPVERFEYFPTRQPVVLDWWQPREDFTDDRGAPFTTVANWKQTSKDIEWQGEVWTWSKHVQFREYLDLPQRVGRPLELALALPPDDDETSATLRAAGWSVVPAAPMSRDIDVYREYLRDSAGEFSVAKEQYVRPRSGWFSDRTATYLATGRPAIVQDAGFGCAIPVGEGLFAFSNIDDVVAAFAEIESDYPRHARAARELADEYFGAERVLGRLLADASLA